MHDESGPAVLSVGTHICELGNVRLGDEGPLSRFDQGGEVRFGLVGVSRQGISVAWPGRARAKLAWARIARYRVASGSLMIETMDGAHWRLPTSRIPNLGVLLHVFEQLAVKSEAPVTDSLASVLPVVNNC